jgi:hypothetical protein
LSMIIFNLSAAAYETPSRPLYSLCLYTFRHAHFEVVPRATGISYNQLVISKKTYERFCLNVVFVFVYVDKSILSQ